MTLSSVYQTSQGKIKGNCLAGKIEGGILQKNTKYLIMPLAIMVTVKGSLIAFAYLIRYKIYILMRKRKMLQKLEITWS